MRERMIQSNDVTLCTETVGDPGDPPMLLIMGMSASMLWWEDAFCRRLAEGGRLVIRYDHRDTGRSRTYEPGHPEYTVSDLVADAAAILDGYDIAAAHIVGMSMGGALAQLLALDSPDRVRSLVLMSTSPAVPGERDLPGSDASLGQFLATAQVDWADDASVHDYLVDYWRVLWGVERAFDETLIRDVVQRDIDRARNPAAAQNHGLMGDRRSRAPGTVSTRPTGNSSPTRSWTTRARARDQPADGRAGRRGANMRRWRMWGSPTWRTPTRAVTFCSRRSRSGSRRDSTWGSSGRTGSARARC